MKASCSVPVALGLGANLGQPQRAIARAVACLAEAGLGAPMPSSFYRSAPVGCVAGTPPFVNVALIGTWPGTAEALLACCQRIECELGRPRRHSSATARVIDIDILLFGAVTRASRTLTIPHPRLRARLFALLPLAEIAPHWQVPPDQATVAELAARLQAAPADSESVCKLTE